jgi:hypothetical protein
MLAGLYLGIVSWAESPEHALEQFVQDRWIVVPILLGFGVQVALYTVIRLRLFAPAIGASGIGGMMGAGGTASTVAMVACCAHHVSDALPLLGLTAAAVFLGQYRVTFMLGGLATNLIGIGVMVFLILRERRRISPAPTLSAEAA